VCFSYIKGDDPANWVAVDRETGKITTAKLIDRESTFVKDNVYPVTVWAVDDGMTCMCVCVCVLLITIVFSWVTRSASNDRHRHPGDPHHGRERPRPVPEPERRRRVPVGRRLAGQHHGRGL